MEGLNIVDAMFARAASTTERLLLRIIDTLPKLGDVQTIGCDYLINKAMEYLRSVARKVQY